MFKRKPKSASQDSKLGTFLGVFTPTILTIFGVIMYLRIGWVTGQVGLGKTILIVIFANLITFITTLSFSAIATNIRVGVGGAYYMISRSLGLEVGGAIGLPLFLAQTFSVTLYSFGLAESLRILWSGLPLVPTTFLIVLGVAALAYKGASLALKAQVPLMILIAVSIAALAAGCLHGQKVMGVEQAPVTVTNFWKVFAVFFPAVTGIMAGLGLSGDLRDPIRSIPRGAIGAVLIGFIVYLLIPIMLVKGAEPGALRHDPLIWTRIAPLGALLVVPALWGAIFSSAVGSVLGAPRTLQALAADGLAPQILSTTSKRNKEPTAGLIVTLIIALAAVMLGKLNTVAVVISMFFLTVYGMVNLVAALETLSGETAWRPRIQVPWFIALAGGLACFTVMLLIDTKAAVAAILIEIILWSILARREQEAGWGDVRRGMYESLIRLSLVRLMKRPVTPRNWRPHVLVFVDDVERRLDLIRFGTWFSQGRGVVTVCELVVGNLLTEEIPIREKEERIRNVLRNEGLIAFGEVDVVPNVISGIADVAQANGIAGLDSNTVLLGWPRDIKRTVDFLHVVNQLERLNKSVVIGRFQQEQGNSEQRERMIHVWWGGLKHNGDLMLLLAHLITRNPEWRDSTIKVLSLASNELMKVNTERYLRELMPAIRISAEPVVMMHPKDKTVREIIHQKSATADVVFLGLGPPKQSDEIETYAERLVELSESLRTVFFVKNSSLFVGKLVQTSEELASSDTDDQSKFSQPPK